MMTTINRRKFAASLGALAVIAPTQALARHRSRRRSRNGAADLVIESSEWNDGGPWHNDSVLEGSDVLFRATIRNRGQTATPPNVTIRVDFRVNGEVVSWSNSYSNGLAQNATITLEADGGPDDKFWGDVSPGNYSIQATVDSENRIVESGEGNNSFSSSLIVESSEPVLMVNDDTVSTPKNTPVNIDVLGNDGGSVRLTSVQSPTDRGGTAVIASDGRTIVYTPASGFEGTDGFAYEVTSP
jgi:Bacterial Ig domain/CARDB